MKAPREGLLVVRIVLVVWCGGQPVILNHSPHGGLLAVLVVQALCVLVGPSVLIPPV